MIFACGVNTPTVAGIVTTSDVITARQVEQDREHLQQLLSRDDVKQLLEKQGVDSVAASQRVDSMTDAEVRAIAANIDQLPAGAGLTTTELLLIIIIILLII